ncbi:thermolabile L-asparaginase [Aaosphaeria arxii CBS 175.79]|uniref:Thermolabile L-asparaginase n=1 Tax=Aaosphaeria arxii CBS 175.79 TaxID=1450172 RepID=A0A6A5XJT2_9PLEO|nr:thermolabile L-asparaginase [Aaosphaeria arxii CBS 175.79]KAF2013057.1 thermolabile L-asparaginase [Aaosphaeria arxii CBS 175.79]
MPDRVQTSRGDVTESTHLVHAAVVHSSGRLLYSVGTPTRTTLLRSAAKPAQTVAILEACNDTFAFTAADLALMSASHSSEPRHMQRAAAMLNAIGSSESDMRCGGHPPLSMAVNRDWIKRDFTPGPICNNCSGKHAGMLGGAKALGAGFADYHLQQHPMQIVVKRVVEDISGVDAGNMEWAVDGCNLPAPAMPLIGMATMYARFADATGNARSGQEQRMKRVFEAMCAHPEMVGGEKRFCTELMSTYGNLLIGKLGADGCYGVGIRESECTRSLGLPTGGIGIAVKIEDGNIDILYAAVMEILTQLKIGSEETRKSLQNWHTPLIRNTVGIITGVTSHMFSVRKM